MDPILSFGPGSVPISTGMASSPGAALKRGGPDNAQAAKEMEALFVTQLVKAMRKTVPESGLMSGGRGEETMRSFQDEALGQAVAERGGLGLAKSLLGSLNRVNPGGAPAPVRGPEEGK